MMYSSKNKRHGRNIPWVFSVDYFMSLDKNDFTVKKWTGIDFFIQLCYDVKKEIIGDENMYHKGFIQRILVGSLILTMAGSVTTKGFQFPQEVIPEVKDLPPSPDSHFQFINGTIIRYIGPTGEVVIPSTIQGEPVTHIGADAFRETGIISLVIPDSVSFIEEEAFADCGFLKSVYLPEGLTEISYGLFARCPVLTEITIPDAVTYIDEEAFLGCHSLAQITIPDSVRGMGKAVFYNCSGLHTVNLSQNLRKIEEKTFALCTDLASVVIPDSVEIIGEEAFASCENLQSILFGEGLSMIENRAFFSCTHLTALEFKNQLLSVGEVAFGECSRLTFVELGTSLQEIAYGAFASCPELSFVRMPSTVESIGDYAFHGVFYNHWTPPEQLIFYVEKGSYGESYATGVGIGVVYITSQTTTPEFEPKPEVEEIIPTTDFQDVSSTDWYAIFVQYVAENRLIDGIGGYFAPYAPSDRGTVAQALAVLSGHVQMPPTPESYVDIVGVPYEVGIAWCLQQGVMSGYNDTTFGTYDSLTREQFATTLSAFAQRMGVYMAPTHGMNHLATFEDVWFVSSWATTPLAWAVEQGLMTGTEGKLNPQGVVTRAEVAVMLYQYSKVFR